MALQLLMQYQVADEQKKANKQQRMMQRLQERRERTRLYREQRMATAKVQAGLAARGAGSSSAAETIPGSLRTQEAAEQGFLTQAGSISRSMNKALQRSADWQTASDIYGIATDTLKTASGYGVGKSGSPKTLPSPEESATPSYTFRWDF